MADMITRCPKCSTAFRISESMITSAEGMVRCGSCLTVFNSTEHLTKQKNQPSKTTPTSIRPMSQVIHDLEQLAKTSENEHRLISKEAAMVSAAQTKLKKPQSLKQTNKYPPSGSTLFERSNEQNQSLKEDEEVVDEAWALELLKEEDSEDPEGPEGPEGPEESKPPEVKIKTVVRPSNTYEKPHKEVRPPQKTETQPPQHITTHNTKLEEPIDSVAATENKYTKPIDSTASIETEPEKLIDAIAAIEPESLDSILNARKSSLLSRASWALATAATFLILIGQIGWLQFHRLNQQEPYRTFYASVCSFMSCELPEIQDRSKIQTSNLLVRSHPEADNALLVDVILKNSATFKQAFPKLRLTFTNLRNKPIATRQLAPEEYLGGELAGQTMMPIKQGIHIGLEIVDPGDKAVSYSIHIED